MRRLSIVLFLISLSFNLFANAQAKRDNLIQIAFLLDTSNSMDGLIDQAKAQLWSIANEITEAKMNGDGVAFEFALYQYGNDRIPAYKEYVKQVVGFTEDMDLISSQLFALSTNGGQEYCGQVIHNSIAELEWKEGARLKAIYIAGNESFNQGNYPHEVACKEARSNEIKVNTIFCGDFDTGISLNWNAGSSLSLGTYNNIDQNAETVYIETPFDDEIARLNILLNETYISYNSSGASYKENQIAQDNNAGSYSKANVAKRTIFKSKANYRNSAWDLVDAEEEGVDVYKHNDELPTALQSQSKAELKEKIGKLKKQRTYIQKEIACIAKERESYIASIKQKQRIENPFELAILNSLRQQLKKAGFTVKKV